MRDSVRGAAVAAMLGLSGCDTPLLPAPAPPSLIACYGDFARFSNGFIVARLPELHFMVDWWAPWVVPTDGGSPAIILALTPTELAFDVPYEGYRAAYHINRIDGTITQRPNLGGVFFGKCDLQPLRTRF